MRLCLVRVLNSLNRLVVQLSDEAAETVARDELLAVQLEARRGRGVVGLEPLLDGAALVRVAIYLLCVRNGKGEAISGVCGGSGQRVEPS